MNVLEILQFSVGGGFLRFVGCWLIIATLAAAFSNAITSAIAILGGVLRK